MYKQDVGNIDGTALLEGDAHIDRCKATGTILIIDDEPELRDVLGKRLALASYSVLLAEDGLEGIRVANKMQPDLIILDVIMPGFDGVEVAAQLKGSEKTKHIPIIFLSCLLNNWNEKMGPCLFKDSLYMGKPYDPDELIEKIQEILERS